MSDHWSLLHLIIFYMNQDQDNIVLRLLTRVSTTTLPPFLILVIDHPTKDPFSPRLALGLCLSPLWPLSWSRSHRTFRIFHSCSSLTRSITAVCLVPPSPFSFIDHVVFLGIVNELVFGQVVLNNFYVIFDHKEHRMGIADSDHCPTF